MPDSHPLIERLARDHHEHLLWLRRRLAGRLAADEVEDVLQAAYARALIALAGSGDSAPTFQSDDQARGWLRTIAANLATDLDRQRHGRRPGERAARPRRVAADVEDGALALRDVSVDVEHEVLETVERESQQPFVSRAIGTLKPEHQQILKLRYGDNLDPPAIMLLEGINRRQWEGRHTRALKAFTRALARLHVTTDCAQMRRHLRRDPATLLRAGTGRARDHVDSCLACGAFARSAQSALATMPLPLPIAAWRYEVLDYFDAGWGSGSGSRPATAQLTSGSSKAATVAGKLAILAGSATLAIAGVVVVDGLTRTGDTRPGAAESERPRRLGSANGDHTGWATHDTPRRALERSAREMARRRARAARSAR